MYSPQISLKEHQQNQKVNAMMAYRTVTSLFKSLKIMHEQLNFDLIEFGFNNNLALCDN